MGEIKHWKMNVGFPIPSASQTELQYTCLEKDFDKFVKKCHDTRQFYVGVVRDLEFENKRWSQRFKQHLLQHMQWEEPAATMQTLEMRLAVLESSGQLQGNCKELLQYLESGGYQGPLQAYFEMCLCSTPPSRNMQQNSDADPHALCMRGGCTKEEQHIHGVSIVPDPDAATDSGAGIKPLESPEPCAVPFPAFALITGTRMSC